MLEFGNVDASVESMESSLSTLDDAATFVYGMVIIVYLIDTNTLRTALYGLMATSSYYQLESAATHSS